MTAFPPCTDCGGPGQIRDGHRFWCVDCHQPTLWREDEDELPAGAMRTGNGLVVPRAYTETSRSFTPTAEHGWRAPSPRESTR